LMCRNGAPILLTAWYNTLYEEFINEGFHCPASKVLSCGLSDYSSCLPPLWSLTFLNNPHLIVTKGSAPHSDSVWPLISI
jgi:hypothetical protein